MQYSLFGRFNLKLRKCFAASVAAEEWDSLSASLICKMRAYDSPVRLFSLKAGSVLKKTRF